MERELVYSLKKHEICKDILNVISSPLRLLSFTEFINIKLGNYFTHGANTTRT